MRKPKGFMKKTKTDQPRGPGPQDGQGDGASAAPQTDSGAPDGVIMTSALTEPTEDVKAERLAALENLLGLMRPAVQADGGDLVLVSADVVHGRVEVMLQGSCSSCAISSTTLQAGVERILRDRLDWVSEVLGSVDESLSLDDSMAMGQGGYVPKF